MADEIVSRINSVVAPDDTVVILGDVAMGIVRDNLPHASRLNGNKLLVPGNHDRCWSGFPRKNQIEEYIEFYQEQGLQIIEGPHRMTLASPEGEEIPVIVSHFPWAEYNNDGREMKHHPRMSDYPEDTWIIHGHVHSSWQIVAQARMYNVGVDAHGLYPVSEEEIVSQILRSRAPARDHY